MAIAHFNRTYEEAFDLLVEARNYAAYRQPKESAGLAAYARLAASRESLRVTSRLTQVMAWLLMQRAVQAGEITRDDARRPEHRLGAHEVCLEVCVEDMERLPTGLRGLLQRSLSLYTRISRLDQLFVPAH